MTNMSIAAMPIASLRKKLRQVGEGCRAFASCASRPCLIDLDDELEQLAMDPRRTPERVGIAIDCFLTLTASASKAESLADATESRWSASPLRSPSGIGAIERGRARPKLGDQSRKAGCVLAAGGA